MAGVCLGQPRAAAAQELDPGAFRLAGRSANASFGVPIVAGHLQGNALGELAEVTRYGPGDPRGRIGVNLYSFAFQRVWGGG
jgi:hypothetical protein